MAKPLRRVGLGLLLAVGVLIGAISAAVSTAGYAYDKPLEFVPATHAVALAGDAATTPATNPLTHAHVGRRVPRAASGVVPAVSDAVLAARGVTHAIPEGRLGHIFRDAPGHLPDTPANRKLLQGVADDPATTLGADKFGNTWSARTLDDGTQAWTQTRNGDIINGGVNPTPRPFNPQSGLSRQQQPRNR